MITLMLQAVRSLQTICAGSTGTRYKTNVRTSPKPHHVPTCGRGNSRKFSRKFANILHRG